MRVGVRTRKPLAGVTRVMLPIHDQRLVTATEQMPEQLVSPYRVLILFNCLLPVA